MKKAKKRLPLIIFSALFALAILTLFYHFLTFQFWKIAELLSVSVPDLLHKRQDDENFGTALRYPTGNPPD